MKPLKSREVMSFQECAEILHQLLPDEIDYFLNFMEQEYYHFTRNIIEYRKNFAGSDEDFELWCAVADTINETLTNYYTKIYSYSAEFAKRLFADHLATWTLACLYKYAEDPRCPERLRRGIDFLFGYDHFSIEQVYRHKKRLQVAIEHLLISQRDSLLRGKRQPAISIDTTGKGIDLGAKERMLAGKFQLTAILLDKYSIQIQLGTDQPYLRLDTLLPDVLSIDDQLVILRQLLEYKDQVDNSNG